MHYNGIFRIYIHHKHAAINSYYRQDLKCCFCNILLLPKNVLMNSYFTFFFTDYLLDF